MKPVPLSVGLLRDIGGLERAWLILGKGPSYSQFSEKVANDYSVFALNHAMRGRKVDIGHAIDIEVFDHLSQADLAGVKYICLPWVPHVRKRRLLSGGRAFFGPGEKTVIDYAREHPVLAEYLGQARLLSYNLETVSAGQWNPELPNVGAGSFSASVALKLLARFGVSEIRTLGVDGGSSYAGSFSDIEQKTKLQTGQISFDIQFREMASTIQQHSVKSGPVGMQLPLRVFVGCMPEQELAYQVLKYSIEKNSSVSVLVERLHEAVVSQGLVIPEPANVANRGKTPFSFQRFAIPALCGYGGRAVYLDSDMLVFGDMRGLAELEFCDMQMVSAAPAPGSGRAPQFSVMVLNCAALRWDIHELIRQLDSGELSYSALMYQMKALERWAPSLPYTWNSLEVHEEGRTQLIHFTDIDTQPWLNAWHPIGAVWAAQLLGAVGRGVIPLRLVEEEVTKGNIRPSILEQLRRNEPDARRLPVSVLRADLTQFFPVHRRGNSKLSRIKHETYRAWLMAENIVDSEISPPLQRLKRVASRLVNRAKQ